MISNIYRANSYLRGRWGELIGKSGRLSVQSKGSWLKIGYDGFYDVIESRSTLFNYDSCLKKLKYFVDEAEVGIKVE